MKVTTNRYYDVQWEGWKGWDYMEEICADNVDLATQLCQIIKHLVGRQPSGRLPHLHNYR